MLNSSKTLIKHILKTRKIVTFYIYWNILIGGLAGAMSGIESFNEGYNQGSNRPENTKGILEINYINMTIMALLIMGLVWLFYKLLYGRFLRKLNANYKELKKIDL